MARVFEIAFNLAARLGSGFGSTFGSATGQLRNLQTNASSLRASLRELERAQRAGQLSASEYAAQQRRLADELARTERAQRNLSGAMRAQQNVSNFRDKSAMGLATTAAAGAVALSPVIAFASAEQSATALKSAMMGVDGNVGEKFREINALAVELGNKLPGATSDFHNLFRVMLQNGIVADQVLGGVGKAAAYLAVQLKLPYEEAGKFAAQMQKSTGTADADMMKFMDTVQKLTNLGVKAEDLNQAFSKFGPTMAILKAQGIDGANSYGTLLAMLTQIGMEGGSAGNSLGKVFRAGFDEKKIGKANEALSEFGETLRFTDSNGEFAGLDNFFTQMEKLKKLNTTQRTSIVKELFGDDAEVLQTVNVLMDKGKAGYDELLTKTAQQASLEQRVTSQLATMTNTWESLTGTVTNFMAALGGPAAEQIKPFLDRMNDFVGNTMGKWTEENQGLIGTLSAVAIGGVAISTAFWGIGLATSTILAPAIAFSRWMFMSRIATDGMVLSSRAHAIWSGICTTATTAWAAAQWLWNAALTANPIGLVIVGIAALIAAGAWLVSNWDTIGPWFTLLWNDPMAALSSFASGIMEKLSGPLQWLEDKWNNLKNMFSGGLSTSVTATTNGAPNVASNALGGIYNKGSFLTTFAEDGPEAAIPLDGSSRALSLWAQAGSMLGVSGGGGGTIINANFSPTVHAGNADVGEIQQMLKKERDDFASQLASFANNERRLSYG